MEDWTDRFVRQTFYRSKEWRDLREFVLQKEPFCRKCKTEGKLKAATVVDHMIDIKDSPEDRLKAENLQPLCEECHNTKTAKGRRSFLKGMTQQKLLTRKWTMTK